VRACVCVEGEGLYSTGAARYLRAMASRQLLCVTRVSLCLFPHIQHAHTPLSSHLWRLPGPSVPVVSQCLAMSRCRAPRSRRDSKKRKPYVPPHMPLHLTPPSLSRCPAQHPSTQTPTYTQTCSVPPPYALALPPSTKPQSQSEPRPHAAITQRSADLQIRSAPRSTTRWAADARGHGHGHVCLLLAPAPLLAKPSAVSERARVCV
jgi:hypothetical protein